MGIVLCVAGIALRRELDAPGVDILLMTGMTFHPLMRAGERIVRLLVMIELPELPSHGLMAQGAIVAEALLVEAVLVTGGAFEGRVLEGRGAVTGLAQHKAM